MNDSSNEGRTRAVERLRGLLKSESGDKREKGKQDGRAWARDSASPGELLTIERHFDPDAGTEGLPLHWIQRLLDPSGERWLTRDVFEKPFHVRRIHDLEYVRGFLTGALEEWRDVSDEVIEPF